MKPFIRILLILLCELLSEALGEYCTGYGHNCQHPQRCCANTCCLPDSYEHYGGFRWSVWNMWYFWFIVIFILMSCFGGCGYWRRRQLLLSQHQQSMFPFDSYLPGRRFQRPHSNLPVFPVFDTSYSTTPPPPANGGEATGFFPSPPPYSEVMNKPGLYPPSKDELPPYPGEPIVTAGHNTVSVNDYSATPGSGYIGNVPGLPPYSPPTDCASGYNMGMPIPTSQQSASYSSPANYQRDYNQRDTCSVNNRYSEDNGASHHSNFSQTDNRPSITRESTPIQNSEVQSPN